MRHFSLISLGLAALFCLSALPAKAGTLGPGTLIKGSGQAVYYLSQNGKRLVFPTENTYKTWYSDFSGVRTIDDVQMAAISLGGNVTYRPGVKLVKITTDPKVYAVAANGTLRHVTTEALATTLYGSDWSKKVDDVPDAFFTNYKTGSPIVSVSDYDPSQATTQATSIDVDKATVSTFPSDNQNTTSTSSNADAIDLKLVSDKTTLHVNDTVGLNATAAYAKGMRLITLFFDDKLVTTCNFTTLCSGSYKVPGSFDKTTYVAKAIAQGIDMTEVTKTVNIPVATSTSPDQGALITIDQPVIRPGQFTGITVETDLGIDVKNITIYVNGNAHKGCDYPGRSCKWSEAFTGTVGTVYTAQGTITDILGRVYYTAIKTITLSDNDVPAVQVLAAKPWIYAGETVDITVSGSDQDGTASTDVYDANHKLLKHCDGAALCIVTTGPWTQKGTITFYGKATDPLGATNENSTTVTVQ
ncbi:MAG: hypothetical protein PHC70_00590 [Patescibacteria group bacterium]|nr:hypothetical protein [Patescibacteria group bacterium]